MQSRSCAWIKVSLVLMMTLLFSAGAAAQQGPARGPVEQPRDLEKEIAAKHNLDVARYYITKRKAYQGALDRLKEIVESHPDFSRMDEVVYFIGEANFRLGKREVASDYYEKLLKDYPGSQFVKKAKERLAELKGKAEG